MFWGKREERCKIVWEHLTAGEESFAGVSHHFSELLQDLQVEPEEEAESQRATELHLSTRSRRREVQLLQEDVVGPTQGLIVPGPGGVGVSSELHPRILLRS